MATLLLSLLISTIISVAYSQACIPSYVCFIQQSTADGTNDISYMYICNGNNQRLLRYRGSLTCDGTAEDLDLPNEWWAELITCDPCTSYIRINSYGTGTDPTDFDLDVGCQDYDPDVYSQWVYPYPCDNTAFIGSKYYDCDESSDISI